MAEGIGAVEEAVRIGVEVFTHGAAQEARSGKETEVGMRTLVEVHEEGRSSLAEENGRARTPRMSLLKSKTMKRPRKLHPYQMALLMGTLLLTGRRRNQTPQLLHRLWLSCRHR